MIRHWAHGLIGLAHTPARNCWWLVREAWRRRWGDVLPVVAISDEAPTAANYRAIRRAAALAHARRVRHPQDGDVVVLAWPGRLHVGMVCVANGRLGVLQSDHSSGVTWQPWGEAIAGAGRVETWGKHE